MARYFVRRKLVTMVIYMTLLTMGGHVRSQSNEKKIIDVILADYDKRVRPVSVDSTVTMVTLDLTLTHIIDMQNKKQVLNMLVYMTLVWEDELLHWYPPDYGNVDRIVIPASDIWIPDIRLWNRCCHSYYSIVNFIAA
ncbi:acetylcholine receptor subunit alpha-L1-like [Ptychodera flava]|uniref:acetylcholine receptor subunit alpha-L1-like n=1 Tax=Ptychodera flava TaxID=63121 RepID=UPI003969F684